MESLAKNCLGKLLDRLDVDQGSSSLEEIKSAFQKLKSKMGKKGFSEALGLNEGMAKGFEDSLKALFMPLPSEGQTRI